MNGDKAIEAIRAIYELLKEWEGEPEPESHLDIEYMNEVFGIVAALCE